MAGHHRQDHQQQEAQNRMTDQFSGKKLPPWHPATATGKHHAHIENLAQQVYSEVTTRNRERDDRLQKLRETEAGPPPQP